MSPDHEELRVCEAPASLDPDSQIRTGLALERTFLAWFRTGIALVALGLVAAQFLAHHLVPGFPLNHLLALTLVLGWAVLVAISAHRYRDGVRRIGLPVIRSGWNEVVSSIYFVIITALATVCIVSLD
jgi:uncharacterized membrane protein YidH (DUF202 family)